MKLFPHQEQALDDTKQLNRVAYYLDMGLGKTFVGSEKMKQLGAKVNLVICQKSKINDWVDHFIANYINDYLIFDLSRKCELDAFMSYKEQDEPLERIGVINYELAFRRPELLKLEHFTLMLDESSMIQNETAKRSRFILKLKPDNVILLSGTPTAGKYEKLWSQCKLLGWPITKKLYWKQYIDTEILENEGYPITIVKGYKNVDRLKRKLREHGAIFMKSDDVLTLPEQVHQTIKIPTTKEYRKFRKDGIIIVDDNELVGDTTLTKMLYERQLCGAYNKDKLEAFKDLLESTNDRLIVFYNFNNELDTLKHVCDALGRAYSIINGQVKDLYAYENKRDSVTLVQYQAGAMGLNLQKSCRICYFSPPLSSELFEQSKKRIHRLGQQNTCFYYYLTCKSSIEEKIYKTLEMRCDYTNKLFEEES